MSPSLELLTRLETGVWRALVDGDAAADRALLSDDFLGVYATGFATKDDHSQPLEAGPSMQRFGITDAQVLAISDDAALLSYRATFVRARAGATTEHMYVTSLWERDGDRWLNTFSQDTPAI